MCQLLNRIFNNCTQLSIHSYHPDKGNKLNVNKTESSVFAAVNREWEGGSRFTECLFGLLLETENVTPVSFS